LVKAFEGVSGGGSSLKRRSEQVELESEFLEQLVSPLFNQASWRYDEDTTRVRAHDQLSDIQPSHDGLSGARIVSQDETQGLSWQHRLVYRGNLVRQRFDVGRMDGHHRIEKEGQVDSLGFYGELEGVSVSFKGPGVLTFGE
jgi:hypothetical protein